jgi:hypothetical protein
MIGILEAGNGSGNLIQKRWISWDLTIQNNGF